MKNNLKQWAIVFGLSAGISFFALLALIAIPIYFIAPGLFPLSLNSIFWFSLGIGTAFLLNFDSDE